MGKQYNGIDASLRAFIVAQRVFFVATAPSGYEGHVNLSPKGLDTLRILGPRTIAYQDFVGSGIETISHLRQNGRIVLMLCSFAGPPRILRLYGRGEAVEPQDDAFPSLLARFPQATGVRAIIRVEVEIIADSCGYGVPLFRFEGHRTQLPAWADSKGEAELLDYQRNNNALSLDGLPGLRWTGEKD
ncbi:MAG: pyridoxamine 5'-phosphate oxidase family protein [Acidobacteria bacterium]|nr:pyridoxamine 5'-phosphate oxidase family protein [Acidobacteriota bacterium]